MLGSFRREYARLVTSGGQLLLLIIGAKLESRAGWLVCLGLIAVLSVFTWASAYRRARAISDTPTSRIASAAQGYTELRGIGRPLGGTPLLSPLSSLPCLWFRYQVERKDKQNRWVNDSSGESDASFLLNDSSGECLVDPEGAEMQVSRKDSWTRGDYRYTEWLLLERSPIYALGEFTTRGSVDLELDSNEDVKALLAEWKNNPAELQKRFDLDQDGQINAQEWELARAQAKREVATMHREARNNVEVSILRAPTDGRLFLISDLDESKLEGKYRLWLWLHLAIFFGSLIAFAKVLL